MRTEVIRPFSYKKPGCAFALHRKRCSFFEGEQYKDHVLINARTAGTNLTDIVKMADAGRRLV